MHPRLSGRRQQEKNIAGKHELPCPLLKSHAPGEELPVRLSPRIASEVVNHFPAPDYKYSFGPKRPEPAAKLVMERRRLAVVDTQLNDGDIGLGKHVREHRPRSGIAIVPQGIHRITMPKKDGGHRLDRFHVPKRTRFRTRNNQNS